MTDLIAGDVFDYYIVFLCLVLGSNISGARYRRWLCLDEHILVKMIHTERVFEIDDREIRFRKVTHFGIYIAIFTSLMTFGLIVYSGDFVRMVFWIMGCSIGVLSVFFVLRKTMHLTGKIRLSDIDYVETASFKSENGENIFKGTGQVRNFFPAGFNKENAGKLIFIHEKDKSVVSVFSPENYKQTITILRANSINVVEK